MQISVLSGVAAHQCDSRVIRELTCRDLKRWVLFGALAYASKSVGKAIWQFHRSSQVPFTFQNPYAIPLPLRYPFLHVADSIFCMPEHEIT